MANDDGIIKWLYTNAHSLALGVLATAAILYAVFNALGFVNVNNANVILLTLISLIGYYLISTRNTIEKGVTELAGVGDTICSVNSNLDTSRHNIKEIGKHLKMISTEINNIKVDSTILPITRQDMLYNHLEAKVVGATQCVYLMHLDPYPPTSDFYKDNNRTEYFENCLLKAKEGNVPFWRIVNIENQEMLDWVENLIKDTSELLNYHIAYIHMGDIQNSFPYTITSCQIVDKNKIFLLNPVFNYVPEGDFLKCAYIENEEVVSMYTEYYNRLWINLNDRHCDYGCVIKNGPGTRLFEESKERIRMNFTKRNETT